ncbi:discoidin domain-containing protein [Kitasatospora purpeofusca]|uniref:galactose-binding domain-containing protein n=1 Tax=Kitasatospora purpeofusca TaxID=67352 RepID=UPI00225B2919|nr:discoidin domain-containing protein [Kitasatospora purpeofusca]MCX4682900.1 discoidin domain-containing protein [Kitasatospora purpeofusca]
MFRRPALRAPSRRTAPTPVARPVASLVAALALLAGSAALFPSPAVAVVANPYGANDAPVLIVLGQSNAEGWGAPLDAADKAKCQSLDRVKGLNRTNNRVAGATSATWSPYTCVGNNLGEEHGEGLNYNVASATALRWQRATEAGTALPDLNVIHIAWGSQGIQQNDTTWGKALWWPDRDPTDVESLFPLAINTISNGLRALREAGKQPRIVGIHWNQWEAEASNGTTISASKVQQAFLKVFDPLRTITGGTEAPFFLYRPRSTAYNQASTGHATQALTAIAAAAPYKLLDAANATSATGTPLYQPTVSPNFGIFTDTKHYTADVHKWFADQQWKTVFTDKQYGAPVKATVNAALGRPATQSSTNTTAVGFHSAGLAVDGDPSVGTTASLSATTSEAQPWWQTDLGATRQIRSVEILNRSDSGPNRLTDLYVMVSPTDLTGRSLDAIKADPTVRTVHITGSVPKPGKLTVPVGADGRFVRVQLGGSNYLTLAEVQVNVPTG